MKKVRMFTVKDDFEPIPTREQLRDRAELHEYKRLLGDPTIQTADQFFNALAKRAIQNVINEHVGMIARRIAS